MQAANEHLELVRDALHARDMKEVGCFVFNKASERLQKIGEPILPALEHVLREEVMPNCPLDPKAQQVAFPGLNSLVVDYLQIVKREGLLERAKKFVSSLRGAVLIESIRYISIGWEHVIPEQFMKIVETAADTGSPEEREIAFWALDRHRNKSTEDKVSADFRQSLGISM